MKNFLFVFTFIALIVTPLIQAQDQVIYEFKNKGFSYGYEGWANLSEVQTKAETGVTIAGPSKGGAGIYFPNILDIIESTTVEVKIKKGLGNNAKKLLLKLMSASNGAAFERTIPLDEVSDSEFTTIKLPLPAKGSPGTEKLEEIKQLQIQGDFTPSQKVEFEIESIIATKAPVEPAK